AEAALRAGAGKVAIATIASACTTLGLVIPEARVIALDETPEGAIAPHAAERLKATAKEVDALVIGPGMADEAAACALATALLRVTSARVVLDARAMAAVRERPR